LPSDLNKDVPRHLDEAFKRSYARLEKRFTSAREFITAISRAGPPPLPSLPPSLDGGARSLASPSVVPGEARPCPHCHRPVDVGDQFCMHCGVQLVQTVRRCHKCGAYPDVSDRFCIFCGETLASPTEMTKA
jgi:hypothetical protein